MIMLANVCRCGPAYPPVLLQRKANRLLKTLVDSERGRLQYKSVRTPFQTEDRQWQHVLAKGLLRPFALFIREPVVQLLGVYQTFSFGLLYSKNYFQPAHKKILY